LQDLIHYDEKKKVNSKGLNKEDFLEQT